MRTKSANLRHHLLLIFACGTIAAVEVSARTDWFAPVMVLFLIALASRTAQVLWACVLLLGLGTATAFKGTHVVASVEADFLVVRLLFLTVLAASERLFATHRLAQFLKARIQAIRPPVWIGLASASLIVCLGILIFDIVHWYRYASWAVLFFILAWQCPKPARGVKTNWHQASANGALLLVTVLVCLLLVELGLRALVAPPAFTLKGEILRAHETAGYTYIENSTQSLETREFSVVYSISSQGLRDRVYAKKEQDVYRIVCLGDSFTFGYGVNEEDGFPRVLERALSVSNPDRRIQVVNMGTSGYGLWQSEIKFREIGLELEPDLIVLQVFPDNDVRDALRRDGIVLQAYDPTYHNMMDDVDNLQRRMHIGQLRRQSRTFDLLHYLLQPKYRFALSKLRPQFRGERYYNRIVERPQNASRYWSLETLLIEPYPDLELGFSLLEQSMVELVDLCKEEGIPVLMLYIPGVSTTYVPRTLQWLKNQEMDASIYDFQRTSDWMDDVCAAHGWPLVNTKETFDQRAKTEEDLMHAEDGHPTERGHQLIAASLGEYIDATIPGPK